MKTFKFFNKVLVIAHDGGDIHCDELFYTVAKKDYWITFPNGAKRRLVQKYTIATGYIDSEFRDVFRPDHEVLWYFRSKHNAEYLIDKWKRYDEWELKQKKRRRR